MCQLQLDSQTFSFSLFPPFSPWNVQNWASQRTKYRHSCEAFLCQNSNMTNLDQVATIISSFQSIQSFLLFSGWEIFATGQWRWREFNLWCSNSTRISRNKMHLTGAIFPCFPASVKHTGAGKVVYQGACCPPNCQREITCHLLNYVDLKKNCNSLNNRFIHFKKTRDNQQ